MSRVSGEDPRVDAAARVVEIETGPHRSAEDAHDFARKVLAAADAVTPWFAADQVSPPPGGEPNDFHDDVVRRLEAIVNWEDAPAGPQVLADDALAVIRDLRADRAARPSLGEDEPSEENWPDDLQPAGRNDVWPVDPHCPASGPGSHYCTLVPGHRGDHMTLTARWFNSSHGSEH